ncbi:uncharacterized protein LOC116288217 [Actinia tenebrosa]|uniref:Uncharacterized protein LOC116288217 n=1 Tax=Actinia tenebrosa TaxID=6105 RepID=A0A6P8HE55_ACTTE|nr:uncharacterized protein LOC116288217 [Actinia tenebrosa]
MTTSFKILCVSQFVIGFLMLVFGLVDRLKVKLPYSFVMFPIWIGILAAIAGSWGILIGNYYQRRGFHGPSMLSGLRAINIVCAGLAFLSLYFYVGTLSALAYADNNVVSFYASPHPLEKGITSVVIILSGAEMLCGVWLALLNKEVMFLGSTSPIQQQHQQQQHQNFQFPGA